MDLDVINIYSSTISQKSRCDAILSETPALDQTEFDALKRDIQTLDFLVNDLNDNRGASLMDPPYPAIMEDAVDLCTSLLADLQAYATANSLTY